MERLMYLNLDYLVIRRTKCDLIMVYKLFNVLIFIDASSLINTKKTNYYTRGYYVNYYK